jgi:hypothetical protein
MKLSKKRKAYTKKQLRGLDLCTVYCPIRKYKVDHIVCGSIQTSQWRKCFNLECEHLDSNKILEKWYNYQQEKNC